MPVYVQHETLNRVSDVFNAQALWQAPGLALFRRGPLLRDLLEQAPREQRGRAATRCFAHVTLALPQEEVDDDRHLTRGARARELAETLEQLHRKDFGDLLGDDAVRYQIQGAQHLAPGQVDVRFGHALYLPAADEPAQYALSISRDSVIWRQLGPIYPNARLTVLGADSSSATHAVPDWPFAPGATIVLINDGPDAPLEVQLRPKDAFDCSFERASGYYTIRARGPGAGQAPARLLLRVSRADGQPLAPLPGPALEPDAAQPARGAAVVSAAAPIPVPVRAPIPAAIAAPMPAQAPAPVPAPAQVLAPAPRPPAVWTARSRPTPDNAQAARTALPLAPPAAPARAGSAPDPALDATYAPLLRQRLSLVALALPRLSRYRETGAGALQFGIGADLAVGALKPDSLLGFALDANDVLHALTRNGRQRIAVPSRFAPADGVDVQVLAAPAGMAERYSAIICLPQSSSLPVTPGVRQVFGRAAPAFAALRQLERAGCLRQADGSDAGGADRLGLSRLAFGFEAGLDGYRITREAPSQALYHLDAGFGFVASIDSATAQAPYVLPLGQHIVAGHYVLRVEA